MENKKRLIGNIYIFAMLVIYPLAMHDAYSDITQAKLWIFYLANFLMISSALVVWYLTWLKCDSQIDIKSSLKNALKNGVAPSYIAAMVFVLSIFIGFLINPDKYQQLIGVTEYGTGIIFIITIILATLAIKYIGYSAELFCWCLVPTTVVIATIGLIQFLGYDLWHLLENVADIEKNIFMSTIGNSNFVGFFFVMALPFLVYLWLNDRTQYRYLAALAIIADIIGLLISNSDAAIVGLHLELFLMLFFVRNDRFKAKLYMQSIEMMALALLILKFVYWLGFGERSLQYLQLVLLSWPVILIFALAPLLGMFLLKQVTKRDVAACEINYDLVSKANEKISKIIAVIVIAGLSIVPIWLIAALIYSNFMRHNSSLLVVRIFLIDAAWGNFRGYIWSSVLAIYKDLPFFQKLFGAGAGALSPLLQSYSVADTANVAGTIFDDAHNEYLQFLLEYGFVGLASLLVALYFKLKVALTSRDSFVQFKAVALFTCLFISFFMTFQNITLGWLAFLL